MSRQAGTRHERADDEVTTQSPRWSSHSVAALGVRVFVATVPIGASLGFVMLVSRLVAAPSESLYGYLAWWIALCGASTVVLIVVDKAARRLLPLGALLKLSLVFPDQAPSRFKIALRSGTVTQLQRVVAEAKAGRVGETPAEAAERILELVAALNAHDRITRGHSERVRAYTQMIAEELGLPKHDVELLHWAGLLHDIGKLEVPYEILNKTTRPTEDEWAILKLHPEAGARLVAPLNDWLGEWVLAVGEHHERWDGRGYPHGLAGTDIAYAARIVAVADVFDVITSARSYKDPIDATAARAEIARCAETHFDPAVARAFLNISIGRLRLAMGPLSLLAQSPLGGISIPPVIGAAVSGLAVAAASIVTGIFAGPSPPPARAATLRPPAAETALAAPNTPTVRVAIDEDTPTTITLAGVATDHLDHVTITASPRGTATPTAGTRVAVTPPRDFNGTLTFDYRPCWSNGCATGKLIVAVRPVNDAPVPADDTVTVLEDQVATISPLTNDTDPEGDQLALAQVDSPRRGRASILGSTVRYTPPTNFSGPTTFGYTVRDTGGATARGSITVDVLPVNDAPVALNDSVAVAENTATVIAPLSNDTDRDGDPLTLTAAGPAVIGGVSARGNVVDYLPPPGFSGTDRFAYAAQDPSGATASAFVTITVTSVNDAPTFTRGADQTILEDAGPQTVPGWASTISPGPTNESTQTITFTATNDNNPLFTTQPTIAPDGTLTYTPTTNAYGTTTITLTATDTGGTTNGGTNTSTTHTFTITITPVPPEPQDDAYAMNQNTVLTVTAPGVLGNDVDVLGHPLTVQTPAVSGPTNGTLALAADGSFTYTPTAAFIGTDTFVYRVDDGGGLTATATVTITVNSGITTSSFYLGTSGSSAVNYDLITSPPPAATPVPDFDTDGDPGLTIKNGDGKETISDPRKYHLWTYTTPLPLTLDGPVSLSLWSTMKDFDTGDAGNPYVFLYDCESGGVNCVKLASTQVLIPNWNIGPTWTHRTITIGSVSRTFLAGHELRVRLLEGKNDMWVAMTAAYPSRLDVTLANAAPVTNADSYSVLEDAPTTNLAVLGNDSDVNMDPTTVTIITPPTKGTAVPLANGTVDYTPTADLNGADSFMYQVCDTGGLCS
ncbi:MAG: tandem-95 repeat protein, partial [Acidimicrobiia bacterium]|nr:tandem-95 repeat protein [Acidimicrobiia bacterium]